jgi:hypothetical protein
LRSQINSVDQNVYEFEWQDNEIWFRVDGTLVHNVTFDSGIFRLKEIRIGTDCVGTETHPDVLISHVEIARYNQ